MPKIIPIKELKDTGRLSTMVQEAKEPVFVTKNGYGDMVIMSMETYEQTMRLQSLLIQLDEAEHDFAQDKSKDAFAALDEVHQKHGL
jgi:PHD/YefM family antitoxin component YafN of YafNO toxin-antitoxin module